MYTLIDSTAGADLEFVKGGGWGSYQEWMK